MKALVTGGAGSIGRAICDCLAEDHNLTIVVADRDRQAAERHVSTLQGRGFKAEACALDVTDLPAVQAAADHVASDDADPLEVLVTAAGGVLDLRLPMFWAAQQDTWRAEVEVNLVGMMNATYAVLPHMLKRGRGNIVSISSGKGLRAGPGQAAYSASKAGVIGFTKAIALETARRGIRANSVAPGSTLVDWRQETEEQERKALAAIPIGRRATPRDVGYMVSFLVSERASHITGACFDTSGGVELH